MLSPKQIQKMQYRKELAINSLKILTEIKRVKSTNYFFDFASRQDKRNLLYARQTINYNTMSGPFSSTLNHGVGNCDEKARACWAGIRNKPSLSPHHECMLCYGVNYDHVFIVIADCPIAINTPTTLGALGVTAIVIDGWTEDWYFPNISYSDKIKHSRFFKIPNPRQHIVRSRTFSATIANYESAAPILNI
ncbi:hypothetical protein [Chromobacterium haemolyticum]|uniref:hypothetical protein n=1 Tax=Chromobacterium haemolyticum TaxID=394935 RepID=UPI0011778E0A|nr:hypothetical protein [Chromobacterium haemolyticum]